MSEVRLLKCPFCGEEVEINEVWNTDKMYQVRCPRCFCKTATFATKKSAAITWNTRKPMERIIERIENARQKYQRLVKEQGEKEDEAMNIRFRGVMNIVKEEGGIE